MNNPSIDQLTRFGFNFQKTGVHTARTMMLEDLSCLLSYVDLGNASKEDFLSAIEEDNCLGKRSVKTRKLTSRHLLELYSLDPGILLFRSLLYFWTRDPEARPLLTLLCTYSRDSFIRMTAPFILDYPKGAILARKDMERFIEDQEPGRFSKATLKSTAQNVNSTWTKAGHLMGRLKKIRTKANATPGAVSYALLLSYITGYRGESLFSSEYAKLLDCTIAHAIDLAGEASRRGLIVFKRIGDVMEVFFPNLLTEEEIGWIHEQA